MSKMQILWLDDNRAQIEPFADALLDEGYDVDIATTVDQAEELLSSRAYQLLILDVMVPTWTEEEEQHYKPEDTDKGHKTGFVFYDRKREVLQHQGTSVLVFTIRRERELLEAFVRAGLPEECFATKFALRDPELFVDKVRQILAKGDR